MKTCIALLAAALFTTACSGYDPYNGFDGPPALSDLGFPDPGVELTRISCSIWRSDGMSSGGAVYRARADAQEVADAVLSSGEPSDRVVERSGPEPIGEVEVVRIDEHRELAVVPIEDGVEVIAFLSEVPDDVGCGSSSAG